MFKGYEKVMLFCYELDISNDFQGWNWSKS
jgi:hypothetical protein